MSHPEQQQFIKAAKEKFPTYFHNVKVLEIGSLNINGTVRQFFSECSYIGIDVGPGPGVDVVCEGQKYDAMDNTFDTTISCECFEHNPFWKETFSNMHRMTRSNGLVIMSCATTGRREHGTSRSNPQDSPLTISLGWNEYYQNLTEQNFIENFNLDEMFSSHQFIVNNHSYDLYFWGLKK